MARSAPKCEKTVQALLCRNLNVKSATLPNATSSRRIRLQDDLVTGFHFSVSERFVPGSTLKASIVELIREGLVEKNLIFGLLNLIFGFFLILLVYFGNLITCFIILSTLIIIPFYVI
ncbi:putative ATP synthase, F0 complex, subunit B/MI25 [Helianthus annuus]|uniref:ATP synthase protein MI25 n=1 Tax=Helianthus annuus TaxID=4232 RepID=A0A9K3HRJ3_HELAN|nr:putative ATP synthase, F0 complex, subunit B/MI25 [Helianthus annuus]KAJ0502380.1 putative ATP synthase, F0 complex, subunit B/MI25 [Helianthus annuus]KAJ0510416.1 putative ATP synthase, F0 complex, subunit B/MI25 [Helianthus annuus]KAJ0518301.1 putative ATP synthase, F0 complex, subunit B/MI25 [Helianthus annuus]KAJ0686335.1 putative ATP synthase, F0 complex, subunit B/MI25 [Helianthus annuus]